VEVVDKDNTKLYGTNVEIYRGEELVAFGTAEKYHKLGESDRAQVEFELDEGVYFIKMKRGSYPDNVVLVNISGKQDEVVVRKLVMDLRSTSYNIYGQVVDEDMGKWVGQKIYAIDVNDVKKQEARIFEGGYFAMPTLYPSFTYRLKLGEGDEKQLSSPFSYEGAGVYYLKMDLRDEGVLVTQKASLFVPKTAELYSRISVYIKGGEKSHAGEEISAITPGGELALITDENGMVQVQAAQDGEYIFAWNGQEEKTIVGKPYVAPEKPEQTQEPAQIIDEPVEKETTDGSGMMLFGLGFAGAVVLVIVVIVIAVIAAFSYFAKKTKEEEAAAPKKEEPAAKKEGKKKKK